MERSSGNFPFSITSLCFFYLAIAQDGTVCNFRQTFNTVFIRWTNGGRWCPSSPAVLRWPWPVGNVLILFHNAKQPSRSDCFLRESVSGSRWENNFQLFVISTEEKQGKGGPMTLSSLFSSLHLVGHVVRHCCNRAADGNTELHLILSR